MPANSSLRRALELGRRARELQTLMGGEAPENAKSQTSIRKLSAALDERCGVSTLWRALALYRLSLEYPELVDYQHLGVGHFSVILSAKGPLRVQLMRCAEEQRWSRRYLQTEVLRMSREE